MNRLTSKEKKLILQNIFQGKSLSELSIITGRSKSTIYYYYKKHFGKSQKEVTMNFFEGDLGEFLGIFAGDGSFYFDKNYKYSIKIHTGFYESQYHDYLIKFCTRIFDKPPRSYLRPGSVYILHTILSQFMRL